MARTLNLHRLPSLLLLASLLLAPSCRCLSSRDSLARLDSSTTADVQRDHAASENAWESAKLGDEFYLGDAVRTGPSTQAELELNGDARLTVSPGSVVRFISAVSPGVVALDLVVGDAVLETRTDKLRIVTRVGEAVIDPTSRVHLRKGAYGVTFEVEAGNLAFERPAAPPLSSGKAITVDVGGVILDSTSPAASAAAAASSSQVPGSLRPEDLDQMPAYARPEGSGAEVKSGQTWLPLPVASTRLEPATQLRSKGTQVEVTRGPQRVILGAGEFIIGLPGGVLVESRRGELHVPANGAPARLSIPGGVLVTNPRTSAGIQVDRETSVEVDIGGVEFSPSGGGADTSKRLAAGESGRVRAGQMTVTGHAPSTADIVVAAGDSFTVHDPAPPTVVGFRLSGKCPDGAVVRAAGVRSSGLGQVNAALPASKHHYEIHCVGESGVMAEVAASGDITILRDAGIPPPLKGNTTASVSTDGRRYRVLYEASLPGLSITWDAAPPAKEYTLTLTGGGGTQTRRGTTPQFSFAAGSVPAGEHQVYIEAAGEPYRRSRTSTISIEAQAPPPRIGVLTPPQPSADHAGEISLRGEAEPGWTVTIGGESVPLSGSSFERSVSIPPEGTCVPVVFSHPTQGTHYYLRRIRSSRP